MTTSNDTNGKNGNGTYRLIAAIAAILAMCGSLIGGTWVLATHIGNESIHTPMNLKMSLAQQAAESEANHLKELLLGELAAIKEDIREIKQHQAQETGR